MIYSVRLESFLGLGIRVFGDTYQLNLGATFCEGKFYQFEWDSRFFPFLREDTQFS